MLESVMNKYKRIIILGQLNITDDGREMLKKYSDTPVVNLTLESISEPDNRKSINEADAVLVSYDLPLSKEIIKKMPNLKYIGVCGGSTAKLDVNFALSKNLVVTKAGGYGDDATVEFIFYHLINLIRGFGKYQWKKDPAELSNKTLGVVGAGSVGKLIMQSAKGFKMNVLYNSKSRKAEIESDGITFVPLDELITKSDFIILQVPKNVVVLTEKEFKLLTPGKILVNTCLGKVFSIENFQAWIDKKDNYAIFDRVTSDEYYQAFKDTENVIFSEIIAGLTIESKEKLTQMVIDNIEYYLKNN